MGLVSALFDIPVEGMLPPPPGVHRQMVCWSCGFELLPGAAAASESHIEALLRASEPVVCPGSAVVHPTIRGQLGGTVLVVRAGPFASRMENEEERLIVLGDLLCRHSVGDLQGHEM